MQKKSITDDVTWCLLMDAFKNDPERMEELLNIDMKDVDKKSIDIISAQIAIYAEKGNIESAVDGLIMVIDEKNDLPRNYAMQSILEYYSNVGDVKNARRFFSNMVQVGLPVNESHCLTLGRVLVEKGYFGEWDDMFAMLESRGGEGSIERYHLQMTRFIYDTNCHVADAEDVLDVMIAKGISPTRETYELLMEGYCVADDMDAAYKLFEKMELKGIKPSKNTYLGLIAAYAQTGNLKDAAPLIQHFTSMSAKEYIETHESALSKE